MMSFNSLTDQLKVLITLFEGRLRVIEAAESAPYFKYPKNPMLKYMIATKAMAVLSTPLIGANRLLCRIS